MWICMIAGGPRSRETVHWQLASDRPCPEAMIDSLGTHCVPVRVVYGEDMSSAVFRHPDATDDDVLQAISEIDEIVEMAQSSV